MNIKNARFWTYENGGWVKITLKPKQSLSFSHYSRDDEGHSYSNNTLTHTGKYVCNEWEQGGRDCDGRTSSSGVSVANLNELRANDTWRGEGEDIDEKGQPIRTPKWERAKKTRCYDENAENANY